MSIYFLVLISVAPGTLPVTAQALEYNALFTNLLHFSQCNKNRGQNKLIGKLYSTLITF